MAVKQYATADGVDFKYAKGKTEIAVSAIEKYENSRILIDFAKYLLERKK